MAVTYSFLINNLFGVIFMEYRQATREDVDSFVKNRMEFATSIRDISNIEEFENRTREYIYDHIEGDDLVIFVATHKDKIVSSCMASIYKTAPKPSCPKGITAELLNVYTLKEYRRMGCAEKLIEMLIKKVKDLGVEKIILDYTDMGLPLYKKLGFIEVENEMQLRL